MSKPINFELNSLDNLSQWFIGGLLADIPEEENQEASLGIRLLMLTEYRCLGHEGEDRFREGCVEAWKAHFAPYYENLISNLIEESKDEAEKKKQEKLSVGNFYPNHRKEVIAVRHQALKVGYDWLNKRYKELLGKISEIADSKDPDLKVLESLEQERVGIYEIIKVLSEAMNSKFLLGERKIYPVKGVKEILAEIEELTRLLCSFANGTDKLADKQGTPGDRAALKTMADRLKTVAKSWEETKRRTLYFLPVSEQLLQQTRELLKMLEDDTEQRIGKLSAESAKKEPIKYNGFQETKRALKQIREVLSS